jgi:4-amino-4-deoxy-L-arabinose transferase-like glycosyltransferase
MNLSIIKNKYILIKIFVLCMGILFFVPFLGKVVLFDWDEANFAEAAREMLVTKNFLQVQIDYKPFWEKPPLFFWLQAFCMYLFGICEFSARLVNALCGILTLLIVYSLGKRIFDYKFGLLWAMAFCGSFLPHLFFKSGIIDPVFNLFIFLGIYFIAKSSLENNTKTKNLFICGIFLGLATLTKGPVAILIAILCTLVYWFIIKFKAFLTIKSVIICALSCMAVSFLWYGIETLFHGTWFIEEFIKYQIRLLTTPDAGHGRPFWFHFVVILFGCFPASFFAIMAFIKSNNSDTPIQKNFKIWMIILFWVVLILFSFVKTKTVLYSSLSYFPVTFLAAYYMHFVINQKFKLQKAIVFFTLFFGLLIAVIISFFPVLMMHKEMFLPFVKDAFAKECLNYPVKWHYYEIIIGAVYAIFIIFSCLLLLKKRLFLGFVVILLSTALCLQLFMIWFLPKIQFYAGAQVVSFYKELAGKDVYLRPLFKSYADLFYSKKMPFNNPKSSNIEWLLNGEIDKPAYFVARVTSAEKYRKMPQLKEIKAEYGFVYFKRELTSKNKLKENN